MLDTILVYTDGGARGNPGPAAIGAVFYLPEGEVNKQIGELKQYIGENTNNYAEYMALITALEKVYELGYKKVFCHLDSELVVKQLNGQYKIREETLKPLAAKVFALREKFEQVTFQHVRREQNKEADRLVNEALDERLK